MYDAKTQGKVDAVVINEPSWRGFSEFRFS